MLTQRHDINSRKTCIQILGNIQAFFHVVMIEFRCDVLKRALEKCMFKAAL